MVAGNVVVAGGCGVVFAGVAACCAIAADDANNETFRPSATVKNDRRMRNSFGRVAGGRAGGADNRVPKGVAVREVVSEKPAVLA